MTEVTSSVDHPAGRRRAVVVAGLAVFAGAYGWLLISGSTQVVTSTDPGAPSRSLWSEAVPALVAIGLARLIPPRVTPTTPLAAIAERRLLRESALLIGCGVLFGIGTLVAGQGLLYPVVKIAFLLVLPLLAFRVLRGDGPPARAIGRPQVRLAAWPAALAWVVLTQVWPFTTPPAHQLPDPVTLAVGSLVTLLTAGVLEEVFYRGWLQTRLEALGGRWPAIVISALLFAFMHLSRVEPDAVGVGLAGLVAFQGVFGLMQGYLWSRYRNIWVIIAIHVVVNLVYVDLLRVWVLG